MRRKRKRERIRWRSRRRRRRRRRRREEERREKEEEEEEEEGGRGGGGGEEEEKIYIFFKTKTMKCVRNKYPCKSQYLHVSNIFTNHRRWGKLPMSYLRGKTVVIGLPVVR